VLQRLRDWLDHRIGYRRFMEVMLLEHIPGGARWRYVWGSTLLFVFLIQLVTGVLLMTAYSPGDSTAWGSVYFIQYEMDFGWFIRGLHHFGSQTMVVLLGLHMLQVVIAGAHLPPREINWWLGLGLLGIVLGLSLTGYLLPWDQKGYWATQVATNISGTIPGVGTFLQRIIIGGPAYGHHTLTRFYTLHVGILPPLLIVVTILHLVAFRRHGVTVAADVEGDGMFWPEQAFRDLLVSLAIFGVMVFLVLNGHGHPVEGPVQTAGASDTAAAEDGLGALYERWAHAGREGRGANLDAPADPSRPYPARPEWYFLFLFELLKFFEGEQEILGTVVIPNGVAVLLFVLPLLGYGWMRPLGRVISVLVVVYLLGAVASLTFLALSDDSLNPVTAALLRRLAVWAVPAVAGFFLLYLALLGLLRRGRFRRFVYGLGIVVLAVAVAGIGYLAYTALHDQVPPLVTRFLEDRLWPAERKTPENVERFQSVEKFHKELEQANKQAERALVLAGRGIPAEGSVALLRHDPMRIFLSNCAACHSFGEFSPADFKTSAEGLKKEDFKASDLAGFGTEDWIYHFLLDPGAERFLGRSKKAKDRPRFTRMANFVGPLREKAKAKGQEDELKADFRRLAAWLATGPRGKPSEKSPHVAAYKLFTGKKYNCVRCHTFADSEGEENIPMLTGYGSADWLRLMLRAPGHPQMYGENNAMPAFREWDGLAGAALQQEYANLLKKDVKDVLFSNLSDRDREILSHYLAEEHRALFDGQPAMAARKE
jgi:quinol-cytochrome oxidoreductase complex cytochrome b subunit/mono/diheme cytochrome c family protein